ncbi:hypothetical protein [Taibaiella helva]|uniref:hypothetical protein n=1 Tax=Taibaiella helva TaxID=2301235 RepID=UPI000E595117|nr:hypothetical protein [Taibaiella helva]
MKKARLILAVSLLTVGTFAAVTFSSCSKDDVCPVGYTGKDCKTLVRDGFLGTWKGTDICTSGSYNVTLSVNPSSSSEINALINNVAGFGNNVTITGTVTGDNTLQFTNQDVGGSRTLSGTMTFSGTSMSFSYKVQGINDADDCNGSYNKL